MNLYLIEKLFDYALIRHTALNCWPESIPISEWFFKPASSAGDGKPRRLSGSRTVTVEARSSDSGGSGAAAAADTAVITASEPASDAADAAVDDADRSAVASDDTVMIMEISNLQEDGN